MGCGCNKKGLTAGGGQRRVAVYQVLAPNGTVDSEHDNLSAARTKAATMPGSRVRTTTKFM
jgi:hypothetical protein